ncbi:MAG TPA: GGDEF domain-containing protein [Candidatus Competibacteraceae bacterium]|nr:GGDEF domain-containing protein [Candidatus Competibacteraceae bacterium]HRZ06390.1 GGDEF domain-containing protein [Candidatus Competibacteraceae bacterium]HSA47340.1 GGDEF domain-containing protein [Candidatus Competibacteraceae bacterium]
MHTASSARNENRRPRLVPTLLLGAIIAGVLGGVAATVLLNVQHDILRLAEEATRILLPDIQAEVRTVVNLERLKVFGEIVQHSDDPAERREAQLAARILAMDAVYEKDASIKHQVNQVYGIIERMATYRAQQDAVRRPTEPAQKSLPDGKVVLANDWQEASAILENLVQHLSVDAAVTVFEGSARIARQAKRAMLVVVLVSGGLALLFVIMILFVQRAVVQPILRTTYGLKQIHNQPSVLRMRRERLQELDDIASAVGAFGAALSQINERTADLEREIAERQQAQAKLVELATTDSLTGLHNRRHFMETATQEFERARRYRMPLSLLMIDADRFKLINDRFGHHLGDEVLKVLAMTGQRQLREIDLFARLGGEEFAILLPQTDFVDARVVAERLRQAIAGHTIDTEQGLLNFTVSLGLASLNPVTADLNDLLRQADVALYQAKQNGRNRVEPAVIG